MKRIFYINACVFLMFACSDNLADGNDGSNGPQDPPNGVELIFPQDDVLCNEGTNLTPTQSTVFFEWLPNDNAEQYTLSIENLDTNTVSEYETEEFIFPVTIARATPFRWFVTYNLQNEIKQSAIWNFYNAGEGVQTYAPFPAEIISPTMAQSIPLTTSVTLEWSSSDLDNDITSYDVYFGPSNPPNLNTSAITTNEFTVAVVPGTIYFWNIVTKDEAGNSSESVVSQFRVME